MHALFSCSKWICKWWYAKRHVPRHCSEEQQDRQYPTRTGLVQCLLYDVTPHDCALADFNNYVSIVTACVYIGCGKGISAGQQRSEAVVTSVSFCIVHWLTLTIMYK